MVFLPIEEEEIGLIDGQTPDSKEEYWVYLALLKYDIDFDYQWEIGGGTSRRGGITVDFVVWNPIINPLLVHSDYWHKEELKGGDKTRLVIIADYFKMDIKNILILLGTNAQSEEDVDQWVRENVAK